MKQHWNRSKVLGGKHTMYSEKSSRRLHWVQAMTRGYTRVMEPSQENNSWVYWLNSMMTQKKNMQEHNPHWLWIPDHPYRILIFGGSKSEKTNALLNLKATKRNLILRIHMNQSINYWITNVKRLDLNILGIHRLPLNTQMI